MSFSTRHVEGFSSQCVEGVAPNTITYGIKDAIFLALRMLHDLIYRFCTQLPLVQRALQPQTHMDDIFTGAETIKEAYKLL